MKEASSETLDCSVKVWVPKLPVAKAHTFSLSTKSHIVSTVVFIDTEKLKTLLLYEPKTVKGFDSAVKEPSAELYLKREIPVTTSL